MTSLRFEGCEPWPLDNEIIELVIGSERFDLHNDADLVQLTIRPAIEHETVTLSFRARPLATRLDLGLMAVVVEFENVSGLQLTADLGLPHQAGLFSSFEYRGGQAVGFETDWLVAQFQVESVVVTVAPVAAADR